MEDLKDVVRDKPVQSEEKPEKSELRPVREKHIVREYVESILIAILLALVIRTFIVQAFKIPSGSMEDTLAIGDHILVNKFIYGSKIPFTNSRVMKLRDPQRGNVIIFEYPELLQEEPTEVLSDIIQPDLLSWGEFLEYGQS